MQTAAGSLRSAWKFSSMFHCIFLFLLWRICSLVRWFLLKGFFKTKIQSYPESEYGRSVAAVESCFCFIMVAAVIVLELGALFLWFVLLYSQRAASHLCKTSPELLHGLNMVLLIGGREKLFYFFLGFPIWKGRWCSSEILKRTPKRGTKIRFCWCGMSSKRYQF